MVTPRTPDQAADARDALAKALFGALFARLVSSINKQLDECGRSGSTESESLGAGVGVLDIFGFESFVTNSFEHYAERSTCSIA